MNPESQPLILPNRRLFLASFGAALFTTPGLFAEELLKTFPQTEGPFYPDKLPLDTDNDLLIINETITPAVGQVAHFSGRVLDPRGNPVRNALVEIWQCDANGAYLHSRSGNAEKRDSHFQGFGRFLTGSTGEYYFRTIKPVAYPGRTPHIHVKVKIGDKDVLTTQCYVEGDSGNEKDGVYRRISSPEARKSVTVPFSPIKKSKLNAVAANFDIVLGMTPAD